MSIGPLESTSQEAFSLPKDGWVHIAPFGEHPYQREDGTELLEVIDPSACAEMLRAFRAEAESAPSLFPGLLVDYEHLPYTPNGSTEAAGWITDLDIRPNGLWAKIRWSDEGERRVRGGRYRLVSPVFVGPELSPGRMTPHRLLGLALTNQPNLRGLTPITHRSNAEPKHKGDSMKQLLELLGLPPEADEAAILAAVTALKEEANAAKEAMNQKEAAEEELHNRLITEAGITDEAERSHMRDLLRLNRATGIAILRRIKPELKPTLHARMTGTPAPVTQAQSPHDRMHRQRLAIEEARGKGLSGEAAFARAKMDNPALFER